MRSRAGRALRPLIPQLTIQKLEIFSRVVEFGGVTRAAEYLGVAQPAVSAQLRDLESKLGVRLVQRNGRHLALTEAGLRFHRWSEEILTRTAEMSRELSGLSDGASGVAVIGASMTVGTYALTELLTEYVTRFPGISVETQIANTKLSTEAARAGACDFAVLLLDPKQDLTGLVMEPLWDEQLLLIAGRDDKRVGDRADLSEIARLPFIAPPKNLVRRDLEDQGLYAYGVLNRRVVLELGHPEAIKRAVIAGLGLAFIEESALHAEVERGDLRVIRTPDMHIAAPLFLTYRRGKFMTEMQENLMQFIRDWRPKKLPSH